MGAKSHIFHLVLLAAHAFDDINLKTATADDNGLLKCIVLMLQDTEPGANLTEAQCVGKRVLHVCMSVVGCRLPTAGCR